MAHIYVWFTPRISIHLAPYSWNKPCPATAAVLAPAGELVPRYTQNVSNRIRY